MSPALAATAFQGPSGGSGISAVVGVGVTGVVVTAGILAAFAPRGDERFLRNVVVWGILARGALLFAILQTIGPYPFAPDAITYEIVGGKLADHWHGLRGPVEELQAGGMQVGYYVLNGALFWLFGQERAAPMLLNLFFGAWLAVPIYHLALATSRRNRGVARWASLLAVFFPSLILWSVLNVREAPTILTLVTVVLLVHRLDRRFELSSLLGILLGLGLLALFREYLFVLVGAAAGLGIVVSRRRSPLRAFAVSCVVLLVVAVGYRSLGVGTEVVTSDPFETLQYFRQDLAYGAESAYGTEFDTSTAGGAIRFLPVGLTYFLFAPFPWQVGSILQLLTLPEQLVWYALIPFVIWGLVLAMKHDPRAWMIVLCVSVLITLSYAMVEGNIGTAYRHRAQVYPFFFLFCALGIRDVYALWRQRRERRAVMRKRARKKLGGGEGSQPWRRGRRPGMTSPVRVLTVIESLGRGGAENLLLSQHRHLDPSRVEARVASLFGPDPLAPALEAAGVPVDRLALSRPRGALRAIPELWKLVRRQRIEVVHTHLYYANVSGRLAAWPRARVVTTLHNPDYSHEDPGTVLFRVKKILDGLTGRAVNDAFLAVSDAVRRDYERHLGLEGVRILRNGIDLDRFEKRLAATDREEERRGLGVAPDCPLLLHVGRHHRQKGLDVLLDALGRPPAVHREWILALVGSGPEESGLRALAERRGIGGRVRFAGTVPDPERWYVAADLFAFPSRYEAFGIALLEAMATGLPAVASETGGIPELTGGQGAVLVPPEDPDALSEALTALLDEPARRVGLGAAARARAQDFDIKTGVRELEALYARLAGRGEAA